MQKIMGGVATNYVYDAQGELAAEYAPNPATTGTQYLMVDHLGSTRLVTNGTGTVVSRYDYLPFGEEIYAGVGGRTTAQGYQTAPDPLNPKFTGKERDVETGLDFFEKRYFSSAQGRFTSPDPLVVFNLKKDEFQDYLSNPQHWNKYAYGLNNPLKFVDSTGLTETIYYWTDDLTDIQKRYFQRHKKGILNAITAKLNQAGIKDVVFKEGKTLTQSQVNSILSDQPKGVAFLNFANKSYAGYNAPSDNYGATAGIRSAVFVGNLQAGNPSASELAFRISEVSSHELGHGMDFYSRGSTLSFMMFWNKDLMNEGQGMPSSSSPHFFDPTIPQNKQIIDLINTLPVYQPPQQ